jgi:3-methyladenine DNA glycosylase AlkC
MADALKLQFGPEVVRRLAREIGAVHASFDQTAFRRDALHGFDALELMDRGRHLGATLQRHLPQEFGAAVDVLLATLPAERAPAGGMSSFFYLAHTEFVRQFGVPHFEHAMRALHALTQVFTGEFAIRPLLEHHQAATLARLHSWLDDPSVHVRRLISEGTRPRLPWAPRLRAFQRDPAPVIALLERLRDDPDLYVRRSVANNLHDIGKDHPVLLTRIAAEWMADGATPERQWIVRHALRTLVKRAAPAALAILGFASRAQVEVVDSAITPRRPQMGSKIAVTCTLRSTHRTSQRVVVDLRVHFVKAHGGSAVKVFKVAVLDLAAGAVVDLRKTVSLEDLSTRRHYPGEHLVELQMNGAVTPIGAFTLRRAPRS